MFGFCEHAGRPNYQIGSYCHFDSIQGSNTAILTVSLFLLSKWRRSTVKMTVSQIQTVQLGKPVKFSCSKCLLDKGLQLISKYLAFLGLDFCLQSKAQGGKLEQVPKPKRYPSTRGKPSHAESNQASYH